MVTPLDPRLDVLEGLNPLNVIIRRIKENVNV